MTRARAIEPLPGDAIANEIVLQNKVIIGSVNANRWHYYKAAQGLARADRDWLTRLVTRRVPVECFADALTPQPDDIKAIIEFVRD